MGNLSESPNSDLGISIASPLCHLFSSLFSSLCFLSPLWNGKKYEKRKEDEKKKFRGGRKNFLSKDNDRERDSLSMLSVRNSCNDRILMSLPIEISRLSVEFEGKVVRDLLLIREESNGKIYDGK